MKIELTEAQLDAVAQQTIKQLRSEVLSLKRKLTATQKKLEEVQFRWKSNYYARELADETVKEIASLAQSLVEKLDAADWVEIRSHFDYD